MRTSVRVDGVAAPRVQLRKPAAVRCEKSVRSAERCAHVEKYA